MSSQWKFYVSDGSLTLSQVCRIYNVGITDVINFNSDTDNSQILDESETTRDYLTRNVNRPLISGLVIRIPYYKTGGLSSEESLANRQVFNSRVYGTRLESLSRRNTLSSRSTRTKRLRGDAYTPITSDWKNFNCYFYVLADGNTVSDKWMLPVFPQEFSDDNSAQFNSVSVFGRSVSYQIYEGTSRDVSLTLQLHEELCPTNYNYIHNLVARVQSATYPEYKSNGSVKPPEVVFVIGSQFRIRGILKNCSASWKAPIINGKLVNCDLSIGITETAGPFSMSEVSRMKGYRDI